jgi:hypothetical protein
MLGLKVLGPTVFFGMQILSEGRVSESVHARTRGRWDVVRLGVEGAGALHIMHQRRGGRLCPAHVHTIYDGSSMDAMQSSPPGARGRLGRNEDMIQMTDAGCRRSAGAC